MMSNAAHLARFRADPSKVRVSVRRIEHGWLASVLDRATQRGAWASDDTPEGAVTSALLSAACDGTPGIDLDMGRTYPHPQRRGAP